MRLIILTVILVCGSFWHVTAQKTPPPPTIYSAPNPSEIKEFISDQDGFKVSFPGIPKAQESTKNETRIRSYSVNREGSNSMVSVMEFKPGAEFDTDQFIASYKEGILNLSTTLYGQNFPNAKIVLEKDFQSGKNKGKEFHYEWLMMFYKVRLLFVDKKVYEVLVNVSNWHILKDMRKEKVEEFERESERFLNSFQVLENKKEIDKLKK
ncbi:MAG: hypothetical protein JSS81_21435 [Acidobacteria bacterium]|nr:hypothetical protein [Acidobacteriota bacterium]